MADWLIQVEELSYRYEDGTQALCGIDMRVARAERVGLVGPNGSGKSTLLLCLSGLLAGEGVVRLDGEVMTRAGWRALRGRVGLVFQSPDDQLFMPTLADDLAFGPINQGLAEPEVDRRVGEAATAMSLADMLERAPHHLSMGQKRNAAIAAVLAMRPAVLLMDEPSSNLDPRSRRRLIEVLAGLEATLLVASHDLALVGGLCERVLVIDEGRIIADGPSREVLGNADLMHRHGLEPWRP